MGAGKDTAAELMMLVLVNEQATRLTIDNTGLDTSLRKSVIKKPWEFRKFAGKLKQIASILTGVDAHHFEDQEFKTRKMGKEWGFMTYREFLQRLGTEAIRTGIHPQAWVNAMFADFHSTMSHWLITDCRFKNEADAVKQHKGIVVRINNPSLPVQENLHSSETDLDDYAFDYVIENDGTMDEFYEKIKAMLHHYELL
jgi:hypothetical protein